MTVSIDRAARVLTRPTRTESLWTAEVNHDHLSGPIVSEDTVVTSGARTLRGHDLATGAPRWSLDLGQAAAAAPVVGPAGAVLAITRGGVTAVDAGSGALRWRRDLDLEHLQAAVPLGPDGLLLATQQGTLTALDGATGETRWSETRWSTYRTAAASADGRRVATANGMWVEGFDGATGAWLWRKELAQEPSGLAATGDRVYVATRETVGDDPARIQAFDAATGEVVFTRDLPKVGPFLDYPQLAADGAAVYVGRADGSVRRLDGATGDVLWERSVLGGGIAYLVPNGPEILVTGMGQGARVAALDAGTGAPRWQGEARGTRLSSPATDGRGTVVATEENRLHAFLTPEAVLRRELAREVEPAPSIEAGPATVRIGEVELPLHG